ncbi:MAG: Pyruvate:ferredoxin oxidoreductase or related 2-oxoacid:ferredoxin oxidoreductase [Candidatus Alkanophagales archaeon MCA70_species_2]|nr:Pyruvate:ferredoxin oxidoreductase or related 2-oxoacid:ferredoxin oxidoreductase [Candidatus Alkanophaga liquidiphilum]
MGIIEVRIHGRGGQGGVTLAELVAHAAISEGKYAQSMPSFGPERRGAPVLAFLRISDSPIRVRTEIKEPDVVVVLDPTLLDIVNPTRDLKEGGLAVVNTKRSGEEIKEKYEVERVAFVDASSIAKEILGRNIVNTTMIGALLKARGIVKLESLEEPLQERFGDGLAEKNMRAMREAYERTNVF